MLRTSEFWIAIVSGVGTMLTGFGLIDRETWDKIIYPALIYIIGRLISKFVKKLL